MTWGGQYEGFLSPALAWGGLELGKLCFWEEFRLLSVTWGGQYGGFLSPALAWGGLYGGLLEPHTGLGWSSSGREFLFALGDLGWSVWGAS